MRSLLALSLLLVSGAASAAPGADAIVKTDRPRGWILRTKSSSYQILVTEQGVVKPVFYGPSEQAKYRERNADWSDAIDEVPVRGGLPFKTPALEVIFADGVRDADLEYVRGAVIDVGGRQTLEVVQKDRFYPLRVVSYIRVLPEFDILEKWIEVKNTGAKDAITVENLMSGSVVLPPDEYVLTQLSGTKLSEFQPAQSLLTPGLKLIQNKAIRSNFNAPWFLVRPQSSGNGDGGPAWFGSIHYSGNWELALDKTFNGPVQILGGINFWDTNLHLAPGESFTTPKFSVGFTEKGPEGAAQRLSAYVRNEILPAKHRFEMRPVVYDSWFVHEDRLREDQQLELAKAVSQLGVEVFLMDAGWYRTNSGGWEGTGSWEVDPKKFPHGLPSFIAKLHAMGLKFGIWVEPENVQVSSDLYRAHPDWILQFPHRNSSLTGRRSLNLAKEEVYQHLLAVLTGLLADNRIEYVKWDQNVFLIEPGWLDAPAGKEREARIRYVENLYRLVDALRARFPRVLFESCSGGGGRVDLGMMSRMDLTWISDNTTAVDRIPIQYGYLGSMPANTMLSWVVERQIQTTNQPTSLAFKFDVAMSGVLGISYDVRKWTAEDRALVRNKIALYKQVRPIVQQGTLYRLVSPFTTNRCALQYNSQDASASVVFCYNLAKGLPGSQFTDRGSQVLKLRGLNPNQEYRVRHSSEANSQGVHCTGDFLMRIGIQWPLNDPFQSDILLLNPAG